MPASSDSRGRSETTPQARRFTLLPWLLGLIAVVAAVAGFNALRPEDPSPELSTQLSEQHSEVEESLRRQESPETAIPPSSPQPAPETEWTPVDLSEPSAPPEPTPAPRPAVTPSYTWYEGATGFLQGVDEAQREGKPMAVYFYTDWCPYCRQLENELLSRAKVEESMKYMVKVKINPEKGSRERSVADRYGVRGYPSLFVQSAPEARPRQIRRTDRHGLMSPEEFVANLERAAR